MKINLEFEFAIGEFVVRRTSDEIRASQTRQWIGGLADVDVYTVIARIAIDEGKGFVTKYSVRRGSSDIIDMYEHELEAWQVYAVRHKLMGDPQMQLLDDDTAYAGSQCSSPDQVSQTR